MDSKYYAQAQQETAQELIVKARDAQRLEALEKKVKLIRINENKAIVTCRKAHKDDEPTLIIEEANIRASVVKDLASVKSEIRSIVPDWREDLMGKAKVLSDKAAKHTVNGAGKGGDVLGAALNVPVQAASTWFERMKKRASKKIGDLANELDN